MFVVTLVWTVEMEALFVLIAEEFAAMLIMLLLIFMFDDVKLEFVVLILPELALICVASEFN